MRAQWRLTHNGDKASAIKSVVMPVLHSQYRE